MYLDSEEHELIRETCKEIAKDYDDNYWQEVSEGKEPEEFWQDCADAGFIGATVPVEYGGEGMGVTELSVIVEQLSESGCYGAGMLLVLTPVFGGITLSKYGSEEQKEEILPELCKGNRKFSLGLTEPNVGHNAPAMETFAEKQGDSYNITGTKQWISGADVADKMVLAARTQKMEDVSKKTMGISLFLVDPDDSNIELRELDVGIPTPESQFEVSIDNYTAPEEDLIGTEGMGLYQLFDTVNPERLIGASGAIGVGYNAIDRAVRYANEREVFDQKIGAYQGVQHPIANAYSKLKSAELLVRVSTMMDDDENVSQKEVAKVSNMAKLRASHAACEATDVSLQVHGGNGFSKDYVVVELWKGARLNKVAPGSAEMMKNFIAEHTLDLPRSY